MRIERNLDELRQPFDVVIVGAGITGVCTARELAGRGLRTLLVEKKDFGGGTSSATSKFIHGGIRYLETYEFGVVRESLRERRVLALAAPHLVEQTRFLMPAWRWSKPSTPLIGAGVGLYDALSFDRNRSAPPSLCIPHPRWLSKAAVMREVPWLDPVGLRGAFSYYDTLNIHPERLLLAFLGSAVQAGAVAINHMEAVAFRHHPADPGGANGSNGASHPPIEIDGVELVDQLTGEHHTVAARAVVNAGGPWMDVVLRTLGRSMGVTVRRSKGVHLLTRPLGGDGAVLARAKTGKHVIVSSWQGRSFIGPTDTPIDEEPDDVRAVHDDVDQILETVNSTMGADQRRLTTDDIEATTVGIRPLIVDEGRDSYHTSRRHELYDHGPSGVANLWSIGGGKWTTGRATGVEVAEALLKSAGLKGVATRSYDSRNRAAAGSFGWAEDAEPYLDAAVRSRPALTLAPEIRLHLARLYGTDHERILDLVERDPALGARISDQPGRWDIGAQVVYGVLEESARTLDDLLDRRLVLGTLGRVTMSEIEAVAGIAAPLLGWSEGAAPRSSGGRIHPAHHRRGPLEPRSGLIGLATTPATSTGSQRGVFRAVRHGLRDAAKANISIPTDNSRTTERLDHTGEKVEQKRADSFARGGSAGVGSEGALGQRSVGNWPPPTRRARQARRQPPA